MERGERSAYEVAILGEKRPSTASTCWRSASSILDATLEDYGRAVLQVAELCVPDFADLCVVEVIGPNGGIQTAAYRIGHTRGLSVPERWVPVGRAVAPRSAAESLTFANGGRGQSAPSGSASGPSRSWWSPSRGGGITLGWYVAATRSLPARLSALGAAGRGGAQQPAGLAIQRVLLHREMQAAAREQGRRYGACAVSPPPPPTWLEFLGLEAVVARGTCVGVLCHPGSGWRHRPAGGWRTGTEVSAQTGEVDLDVAEGAFDAVANRRTARGEAWVAHPLPRATPGSRPPWWSSRERTSPSR